MNLYSFSGSLSLILACSCIVEFVTPFGVQLASDGASQRQQLPDINAAVIVPGFLTGANDFQPLVDDLNARGIPSVTVKFPNWHWIPCLGGRSARPILERIDFTVRHLCANGGDVNAIPDFHYNAMDCFLDFQDNPGGVMEAGGSAEVDEFPKDVRPRGGFSIPNEDARGRVAIIGHSAGGWISRVYLSNRDYGGRAYRGSDFVHSLVTLGTPHGNAPGPAFRSVDWINQEEIPTNVRALAVSGKGLKGDSSGQFTQNAYSFCCNEGSDGSIYDGDGVSPIQSALAMEGPTCEKLILDGTTTHFPWSDVFGGEYFAPDLAKMYQEGEVLWYGSERCLDQWADWLLKKN
mmetsp:Transcript_29434/g.44924  ORF Transcript_29434/g.44924 Transcript_29434/m.44924 type:complete len:348 (-) Transcript_29434:743-1786(-)